MKSTSEYAGVAVNVDGCNSQAPCYNGKRQEQDPRTLLQIGFEANAFCLGYVLFGNLLEGTRHWTPSRDSNKVPPNAELLHSVSSSSLQLN
jgi:hypothetical protein